MIPDPKTASPNSDPIVSVLLPVFNASSTLSKSLASLSAQTFEALEVIVFDDGSTDESASIVEAHARDDQRIRCIKSEHVGIVAGLQRLSEEARGTYLARMDADDVADPRRISIQLDFMRDNPSVALCGTAVQNSGPGLRSGSARYEAWVNSVVSPEAILRDLFVECPIPHPSFLMRRECYEAVGGYQDFGWAEDYDLVMRFFIAGHALGKVDDVLLEWRNEPGRLSRVDERYSPQQFRNLKRHYLCLSYLREERPFFQWGAGQVGKEWLKEWGAHRPQAVVDIHPRKIGKSIHGIMVIPPEELPGPGEAFVLVAVGAPGARDEIRQWFTSRDYTELEDFVFVA